MESAVITEAERLRKYHDFDARVVERVSDVAEQYRAADWYQMRALLPDTSVFTPSHGNPVEVLDVVPREYDQTHVLHLSMANGLDENAKVRIGLLATLEPEARIVALNNPSRPGRGSGKIRLRDIPQVWSGDLRPAVEPTLLYLQSEGLETVNHIGYSYGAEKAAAAAQYAPAYDLQTGKSVLIDPPAVEARSWLQLARQFFSTAKSEAWYLEAAACDMYREARKQADEEHFGVLGYGLALLRLSNLAISHGLTKASFEERVDSALMSQPEMGAHVIWGTESELATHGLMLQIAARLTEKYGNRVAATELPGQTHAMGADLFLQAATILHGLYSE